MTIHEMLARQRAIIDVARRENRNLTDSEQSEFDDLTRSIEALGENQTNAGTESNPTPAPPLADGDENSREAILAAERSRVADITAMCRDLGVDDAQRENFINEGLNIDEVRSQIISQMRTQHAPLNQGRGSVEVVADEHDKYVRAAVDGTLLRGGINLSSPVEGANEFRGMSLKELAVDILSKETNSKNINRKSADDIFTMLCRSFYNPSATFPSIMDQAINKAYVEGHKTANVTFDKFVKKGVLTDFKKHDNYYLSGPAGEFLEVPENGELKADTITDAKRPQRQLKTYGRQFTMTRQAFINDDIGLLTRVPAKYAASARKTQNKQIYQIMMNNPPIYDGKRLFCKDHGNLVTKGTGITADSIKMMFFALSTQKNEFDEAIIIRPSKIVVPVGYAFDMYTLFYSPTINTEGNTQAVNPLYAYKEQVEIIEDATINALSGGSGHTMPWWLIGNSEDVDFIEIDYLNGQEVPTIRRSEQPGTLGFVWDIYHDWGITPMDFRGAIKNPGVTINTSL